MDTHRKLAKRLFRVEEKILSKEQLTLDDDLTPLIQRYRSRIESLMADFERITSQENFDQLLEIETENKRIADGNQLSVMGRVNQFQRLNYLLDCKFKVHSCDIYGRVIENKTGSEIQVVKQPDREVPPPPFRYKWPASLKRIMPPSQQSTVREILKDNPDVESYASTVLDPLQTQVASIPAIYFNEKANTDTRDILIHAHFFAPSSDWYIAEYDPKENLAYGFTILNGDEQNAEWGYISVDELKSVRIVELDFFWEVKSFGEVRGLPGLPSPPPPAKVEDTAASIPDAIEALEIAVEFATGKDQVEIKEAIEALSIALEFA